MTLPPSGAPLGFVAIPGVLALIGILIRYSAILIVQIEQLKEEGRPVWDADGGSHKTSDAADHADRGCRPHPNRSRDFLGSYGVRHNGGIILGMVRTLLFLPALYVASFRTKEPAPAIHNAHENPLAPEMQAVSSTDARPQRQLENA